MLAVALLFFLAIISYLEIGIYSIRLNPKSILNRIFFHVCLLLTFWSLYDLLMTTLPDKNLVWIFHKLLVFSWALFVAFLLRFFMVLIGGGKYDKMRWSYFLIYLPGILFTLFESLHGFLLSDFIHKPTGWEAVYTYDIWYWLYKSYYLIYCLACVGLIWRWERRSQKMREKRQASIILKGSIISLLLGFSIDVVLPAVNMRILPPVAPLVILIWVISIWYAIVKYRLMVVSPEVLAAQIISRMVDLLMILSPDRKLSTVNSSLTNLLGYREQELIGEKVAKILSETREFDEEIEKIMNISGYNPSLNFHYKTKSGHEIPVRISVSIVKEESGQIASIVVLGQDLTLTNQLHRAIIEKEKVEFLLEGEKENFHIFMEHAPFGVMVADPDGRIYYINPEFSNISGYYSNDFSTIQEWFSSAYPDESYRNSIVKEWSQVNASASSHGYKITCRDQSKKDIELRASKLDDGRMIITIVDVTEREQIGRELRKTRDLLEKRVLERTAELQESNRKLIGEIEERSRMEAYLNISLKDKEVLLKEIHHRVKNNLQIVSSLLSLQAGYIMDKDLLDIFRDSQSRIKSIALLHEKLYQSSSLASINFKDYIENLVTDIFYSTGVNKEKIGLFMEIDDIILNMETAIPCGLIINELATNCLKHAFKDGAGEIRVILKREKEGLLKLIVQDNGVGLPEGINFEEARSLGLKLVSSLTRQLSGKLSLKADQGTLVQIEFAETTN